MKALSLANASTHAFDVLIKPKTECKVSATVLGLPEYRATGSAIAPQPWQPCNNFIAENLSEDEIVFIDVAVPQPENPWLKMAGRFKDAPL
jgi:hypothetical protein